MIRRALQVHPGSTSPAVGGVEAAVGMDGTSLGVTWFVTGVTERLVWPEPAAGRADGLWKHTCFEVFAAGRGEGYFEFNLSPLGQWAAYGFEGYRTGMADADVTAPTIKTVRREGGWEVGASLPLPGCGPWRVGISAVIEASDGTVSYWALAHPPGKADFHHADCFALHLPATEAS